jgi:lysophospholipid acyltransferase (LPLAT)-like uncharacterized protein
VAVIPHQSLKTNLLGWLAGQILRLICATLRLRVEKDPEFVEYFKTKPVIVVFWHNRILVLPKTYRNWLFPRPLDVLTSASKDGAVLARAVACFRMGAVRGSSSKRGAVALIQMKQTLEQGISMAISPDGPRGPVYRLASGPIKLAQISGVPIVPVNVHYTKAWRLKSWDRFCIPKPFSRVEVTFGTPHFIPAELSNEAFEAERARVEGMLAKEG